MGNVLDQFGRPFPVAGNGDGTSADFPRGAHFTRPADPFEPPDDLALPHVWTFASVLGSAYRAYWHDRWDEAMRHARESALVMRNDCHLMRLLQERKLAVAGRPWHLAVPDERDPWQQAVRDGLTKQIQAIHDFQRLRMSQLEAIWYGRYGAQVVWKWAQGDDFAAGGKALAVRKWRPVNGDKIGHLFDGTPYVLVYAPAAKTLPGAELTITTRGWALVLRGEWRERFLLHKHEPDDADFFDAEAAEAVHGVGVRSRLFWLDWLGREWLANMSVFLQRAGLGVTVWYFEQGNAASQQAAETAAKEQSTRVNIVWPRGPQGGKAGAGVERLEVPTTGASFLLEAKKWVADLQELYVVGQSMSSGSDKESGLGGSGRAQFARNTKEQIAQYDAANLDASLTGDEEEPGLVWILKRSTYPWADFPVRFVTDLESGESADKVQSGQTLLSVGVDLKADELRGAAGFSKPAEGDEVVRGQQPAAAAPGGPPQLPPPGGNPGAGPVPPPAPPPAAPSPLTPAPVRQAAAETDTGRWEQFRGERGGIGWRHTGTGETHYTSRRAYERGLVRYAFDPDEARDEAGRWKAGSLPHTVLQHLGSQTAVSALTAKGAAGKLHQAARKAHKGVSLGDVYAALAHLAKEGNASAAVPVTPAPAPAPSPQPFDAGAHVEGAVAAVRQHGGAHNLASLVHVRQALAHLSREQQDTVLNEARRRGLVTASALESARNHTPEEFAALHAAALPDGDRTRLGFLSIRHRRRGRPRRYEFDPQEKRDESGKWTAGGAKGTHHEHRKKLLGQLEAAGRGLLAVGAEQAGNVAAAGRGAAIAGRAGKALAARLGRAAWQKLPAKAQKRLARTYAVAKAVEHKVMLGFSKGKELAQQAARERGLPETHVERVGRILGIVDVASAWTVNFPAVAAATGSLTAGKAASWIPVASLAYIGYSAARNPFAVARAARKVISGGKAAAAHYARGDEGNADVGRLLEAFGAAGDRADWYEALLCAALDEEDMDLDRARQRADEAFAHAYGRGSQPARYEFDPDESRDEGGRWTSGAGAGGAGDKTQGGPTAAFLEALGGSAPGAPAPPPAPARPGRRDGKALVPGKRVARLERFTSRANRRKVIHALKNEAELATALQAHNLPDSEPADVVLLVDPDGKRITDPEAIRSHMRIREDVIRRLHKAGADEMQAERKWLAGHKLHFVEVKTLWTQKGPGAIKMSAKAARRKERWAARYEAPFHTVVLDDRKGGKHSGHRIYYKGGVGSTTLGAMTKVEDLGAILGQMRGRS